MSDRSKSLEIPHCVSQHISSNVTAQYGRINPSQRMQPDDKSAFELTGQIVEKEDELTALLSDEGKEFIYVFRLGARIMLEVMDGSDTPSVN